ncbi:basic proline-rich protein-like [Bos indicus x Bos taurus]|uniref:basic proline-rich protein-like n=1 Tax=Bos indicus x Bos taurus TaxID=30522 RepID=UPI000F7D3DE6|nr:basic proline-rich protein-like [Bos indicus x Bos taurus]
MEERGGCGRDGGAAGPQAGRGASGADPQAHTWPSACRQGDTHGPPESRAESTERTVGSLSAASCLLSLTCPVGGPIAATPVVLGQPCSAIPAAAVTDTHGGLPDPPPLPTHEERRQRPLRAEGWEPVASAPSVHLQPCTSRREAHPSARSPAAGLPPSPPHCGRKPVLTEPPADQSPRGPPPPGLGTPTTRVATTPHQQGIMCSRSPSSLALGLQQFRSLLAGGALHPPDL